MAESTFLTSLKMDSKSHMKQKTREDLLESIAGSGPRILQLHQDLQKLADTLDEKVEDMLNVHEKDFFLAYKSHMYTVQKEFKQLKQKADEEETKTRRDAKVQSLEKELDWFMNEALRLDELCKKYKKELDKWKARAEALDDDRQFLENQIKHARKHNRALRGAVERAQTSAYSALVMGGQDSPDGGEGGAEGAEEDEEMSPTGAEENAQTLQTTGALSNELEERYVGTIRTLRQRLDHEVRTAQSLRSAKAKQFGEPSELESFFVRCIDKVKGDVAARRAASRQDRLSAPKGSKNPQIDTVDSIGMEDFTAADRRKVIEMLLSSQQVLVFLYDRLFPKNAQSPAGQ